MIVDQSDYEPGGQWKEAWRELDRNARQYTAIGQLHVDLAGVKQKAVTVDLEPSDGAYMALEHAVRKANRTIEAIQNNMRLLRKEVDALEVAVIQARVLHVQVPVRYDIPAEDDLLERMSDLYGLPKTRPFRFTRRDEDER